MPLPPDKFSRTRRGNGLSPSILRVNKGLQSLGLPILYGQNEFDFSGTPGRDHMTVQCFESLIGKTNADLVQRVFLGSSRFFTPIPRESHGPVSDPVSHTLAQTVPTVTDARFGFRFVMDIYGCALLSSFPNLQYLTMTYISRPLHFPVVIEHGIWPACFKQLSINCSFEGVRTSRTFSGDKLRNPDIEFVSRITKPA